MSNQIYKSLIEISKEVGAIGKDSKNDFHNFKFRGIDAVMNNLHGLFAKHGVLILQEVLDNQVTERTNAKGTLSFHRLLKIKYKFVAEDGSSDCCTIIGESADAGDKSCNKCMAIALKYALTQMLLIPFEEMTDPDSESHTFTEQKQEKVTQEQISKLSELNIAMKNKGIPTPTPSQFKEQIGENKTQLSKDGADKAIRWYEQIIKERDRLDNEDVPEFIKPLIGE